MKKICVYTCITGNYDNLHEIESPEKGIDYLCFTNNDSLKSDSWKIIYVKDDSLDNQRLSRKIKILGHPYIDDNYDISVWMDASVIFKKNIKDFIYKYLKDNDFAAIVHHERNCIYDEAIECIKLCKDKKDVILSHLSFLENEGFPKNYGLYEMTVFIKKHNSQLVRKTMNLWFDMVCNYSKRDQLSFMYCVWKTKMKIDNINLNVFDNEWFIWERHNSSSEIKDYRVYFGNELNYDVNYDIQGEYKKNNNKYVIDINVPCDTDISKIIISRVPYIVYKNIIIKGVSNNEFHVLNDMIYYDDKMFYNDQQEIIINHNFKKNDRFYFEIELYKISFDSLFNYLKSENDKMIVDISNYKKRVNMLENEVKLIRNSKFWKFGELVRKIIRK